METSKENAQTSEAAAKNGSAAKDSESAKLLYLGHASLRIKVGDKVIYIDPFAGKYNEAADLILVTHDHFDHNQIDKVEKRNPDCQVITWKEALEGGKHQSFDLGYVNIEAVEAGNNPNHSVK